MKKAIKIIKKILSVRYCGTYSPEWVGYYEQIEIDKGRFPVKFLNGRLRFILFSHL